MITILLWALSYFTANPIPWPIFFLTSLIDGIALYPLLSIAIVPYILPARPLRQGWGRINLLFAQWAAGCAGVMLTRDGYRYAVIDGDTVYVGRDATYDLDDVETTWYRVGFKPFALMWDKELETIRDRLADLDELEVKARVEDEPSIGVLDLKRGMQWLYTKHAHAVDAGEQPPLQETAADGGAERATGWIVSLSRAVSSLRGGAGTQVSEQMERDTLKEEGGDQPLSMKVKLIGTVSSLFMGVMTGILIFGFLK